MISTVFWIFWMAASVAAGPANNSHTTPPPVSDLVCEHMTMQLYCSGDYVIRILSAMYGRQDPNICGENVQGVGQSSISLSVMQSSCNDQQSCSVAAENSVFTDPLVGVFKYLEVVYECVKVRKCCDNEVFRVEGSTCEPACAPGYPANQSCETHPRCVCSDGYERDLNSGHCVEKCPFCDAGNPWCDGHEVYKECGTSCENTCRNPDNEDGPCDRRCVAGFFCQPGFIRNEENGRCIRPESCPCTD